MAKTYRIPSIIKFNKNTLDAIEETNEIIKHHENYKTYNNIYEIIEEIEN